jgi:hypothetical protein
VLTVGSAVTTYPGEEVAEAVLLLASVTITLAVYVVPAAVGTHVITAVFAAVQPRLGEEKVQV